MAAHRNRLVVAIADAVLVAHASPGGKTELLCRDVLAWGIPLYTLRSPHNDHIVALGASALGLESIMATLAQTQEPDT